MGNGGTQADANGGTETLTSLFDIYVLAREAGTLIETAMENSPMTPNDYALMSVIATQEGCSLSELAQVTAMPLTTVSDWMRAAKSRDWVSVNPGVTDRRRRELHLTELGRALWAAAREDFGRAFHTFRQHNPLGEAQSRATLAQLSEAVRQAAAALSAPTGE